MASNVIGDVVVEFRAEIAKFRTDLEQVRTQLGRVADQGKATAQIMNIFGGVSLSKVVDQLVQATIESVKLAQAERLAGFAFDEMARKAGIAGDQLLQTLRDASGQTISLSDSLKAATFGLQQGLQPAQLGRLMEIARSQSVLTGQTIAETFDQLARATTVGNEKALKQLNIVVDVDKALQKYADSLGVNVTALNEFGRAQAVFNAVQEATKNNLLDTNNELIKQKEAAERLHAEFRDFWVTTVGGSILTILQKFTRELREFGQVAKESLNESVVTQLWRRLFGGQQSPFTGTGLPEEGLPLAGAPGGVGGPSPFDEDQARAILEATREYQRALSGLAITEAALSLSKSTGAIDEISRAQEQIQLIQQRARDEQRYYNVVIANTPGASEKAKLGIEAEKARAKAIADTLTQLAAITEAQKAYNDAIERGARLVEGGIASKSIDRAAEFLEAAQKSRDAANVAALSRTPEGEAFAFPSEGSLHSMSEGWLEAGRALTQYYKAADATKFLTRDLGNEFDGLGYRLNNLRQIIEALSRTDPGNKALAGFIEEYERLLVIRENVSLVFGSVSQAIQGTLQGILQGTQTLSQAFANMGRNIAASLVTNVVERGLKVVERELEKFLQNLEDSGLVVALQRLLGTTISAAVGIGGFGTSTAPELTGTGMLGDFTAQPPPIPAYASGGIVSRPTVGLLGEAGPEAVVPLSGSKGPLVQVNILNQHPAAEVQQRSRRGPGGNEIHEIVIREMRRMVGTGEMETVMAPYNLRRQPTGR